jgi:integrase
MGFFGAYRRAELVGLHLPDVQRSNDPQHGTYLRTLIRRSKRDRTGKGIVRGLWQQDDARVCPVEAFDTWIDASHITEGAIFRSVDRFGRLGTRALSPQTVATIVKTRAAAVDLNPDDLAAHSLRRGLATTADREGRTLSEIADHLDHADIRTTRGYVTHPSVVRNNLTRGMSRRTG